MPSTLKPWLIRLVAALVLLYGVWWLAGFDRALITVVKVVMESLLPVMFADLQRVSIAPNSGWILHTSIAPLNDPVSTLNLHVDPVFLRRAVMWVPAVPALVFASAPRSPKLWVQGLLATAIAASLLIAICAAAHLAVLVNGTSSLLDDAMLPQPPDFSTTANPYSFAYFHAITFAFYLSVIVAPMAMPVVLWGVVCRAGLFGSLNRS
jgi:hypothetical protein